MLIKHFKEVAVELLPKTIRYTIPLYTAQERLLFGTHLLVLEVPAKKLAEIDLDKLNLLAKEPPKKIDLPLQ